MSGHSKWANIKNRKGAQDKKRSEAFTRMAKNIMTAIRESGGNTNAATNSYLREALEKAREVNMPKENVERLIARFEERKDNLVGMMLEGYGSNGVPVMVEIETDNKNRTLGEIKLIFRNHQAALGESNSVSFLFDRVGEIEISNITEEQELLLIDAGVTELGEGRIYTKPEDLNQIKQRAEEMGIGIGSAQLVMKCKQPVNLESEDDVAKVMDLIEELEENEDVINVFAGFLTHG